MQTYTEEVNQPLIWFAVAVGLVGIGLIWRGVVGYFRELPYERRERSHENLAQSTPINISIGRIVWGILLIAAAIGLIVLGLHYPSGHYTPPS